MQGIAYRLAERHCLVAIFNGTITSLFAGSSRRDMCRSTACPLGRAGVAGALFGKPKTEGVGVRKIIPYYCHFCGLRGSGFWRRALEMTNHVALRHRVDGVERNHSIDGEALLWCALLVYKRGVRKLLVCAMPRLRQCPKTGGQPPSLPRSGPTNASCMSTGQRIMLLRRGSGYQPLRRDGRQRLDELR